MPTKTLGQIGYEAYRDHIGAKAPAGGPTRPEWAHLREDLKQAWEVAANHIAAELGKAAE